MGANQGSNNYYNSMGAMSQGMMGYGGMGGHQINNTNSISCIIPPMNGVGGLYLGDYDAATNYQLLQNLGIKAVITSAVQANIHYDHSIVPYHLLVNAKDASSFNLIQYFDQAVNFTKNSLKSTNVLIHCMAGVSRSATLTIAYFMAQKGMSYQNALAFVRQQRPFINPNSGFQTQLKQYETILVGRRRSNPRNSMAYAGSPRGLNMNMGMTPYNTNMIPQYNAFRYSGVQQGYY